MSLRRPARLSWAPLLALPGTAALAVPALIDLWSIPWGKGIDGTPFSWKWGAAFLLLLLLCAALLVLLALALLKPGSTRRLTAWLVKLRSSLGILRWALILALILVPCWLFGFNIYGAVLTSLPLHWLVWFFTSSLVGILLSGDGEHLLSWNGWLGGLLITGCGFVLANSFTSVVPYPFSLGWSEGNRIWDYSVLFGADLYDYPADQKIFAYIDLGRQLLWGLPFLLPHVSLTGFRFWNALLQVLPYTLLGFAVIKHRSGQAALCLLAGAWAFAFLSQGAIYSTLILCAILVALAWKRSLWVAVPLLLLAGYFASLSRWTWVFAPAIWIVMLEFGGAALENGRPCRSTWFRTVLLALAGLGGSFLIPRLGTWVGGTLSRAPQRSAAAQALLPPAVVQVPTAVPAVIPTPAPASAVSSLQALVTDQPLLWYRLFPNATYPPGILLGLLIAVGPLLILLIWLLVARRWHLSRLQKFSIFAPLLAFLLVGLVASVKIGGGSNLHNLDMFIIGMLFTAAIAWQSGAARDLFAKDAVLPAWVNFVLLLLIVTPFLQPVSSLGPPPERLDYERIAILLPADLKYPTSEKVQIALEAIRSSSAAAKQTGQVLFMDQRQLLTFGYVQDVPLVPEFEKKYMMDLALSGDADYFAGYYRALAEQRFSLIITEPLLLNYDDVSSRNFAEENNTWVKWVSEPTLCFYEPFATFDKVGVQLLAPRQDTRACAQYLESEIP